MTANIPCCIIDNKLQSLARGHVLHPSIIWLDTASELSEPGFWASYDVSRIASEAMMLDLRNAAFGLCEQHPESINTSYTAEAPQSTRDSDTALVTKPPGLFVSQEDPST